MIALSFNLAARNVMRNRERSLLTLIGVLLAIGSFVALVSLAEGLGRRMEDELASRRIDVYVLPKRSLALPSGPIGTIGASQDTLPAALLDTLKTQPGISYAEGINRESWSGKHAALPVLHLSAAGIRTFFELLQGVPEELGDKDVLLGQGLAQQEGISAPGATLNHKQVSYTVKSILVGGGFQDYFAFVAPSGAAESSGYQEIWLKLSDPAMAVGVAKSLESQLPPDVEAVPRQTYLTRSSRLVGYAWMLQAAVAAIGVLIAITAAMNTMLMSTYERLREFAVLRAIGAPRLTVALMLLWESVMLSCFGGLLGCLFGLLASGVLDQAVVVLLQLPFPLARVTPLLIFEAMLLALLVGVLGALIPLLLVWRQRIMDGLRADG